MPHWPRPPRHSEGILASYIDGSHQFPELERFVSQIAAELAPLFASFDARIVRAVAACTSGIPPETVSKFVDWKGFEGFCAALLTSMGYRTTQNILFRKPRAQIDILARGGNVALLIDCKHWTRSGGRAALWTAVLAQGRRADLVRASMKDIEPMAVVIVSVGDDSARFIDGAAVVPIHTLRDFADNIPRYSEHLGLR